MARTANTRIFVMKHGTLLRGDGTELRHGHIANQPLPMSPLHRAETVFLRFLFALQAHPHRRRPGTLSRAHVHAGPVWYLGMPLMRTEPKKADVKHMGETVESAEEAHRYTAGDDTLVQSYTAGAGGTDACTALRSPTQNISISTALTRALCFWPPNWQPYLSHLDQEKHGLFGPFQQAHFIEEKNQRNRGREGGLRIHLLRKLCRVVGAAHAASH